MIGTGHVGLLTCVSFAHLGHDVVGIDSDAEKISLLSNGKAPFYEPGVEEILQLELATGRLRFANSAEDGVAGREVAFICVGTPPTATGEANLLAVERALLDVVKSATQPMVVVEKSTVPAGTAQRVQQTLQRESAGVDRFDVASNPEFLREGRGLKDSLEPDRILVGAETERALKTMRAVYQPLTSKGIPLIETDLATAELAKHACNAFLSMKISYINALARVCERAGADVTKVAKVMGSDPRIGGEFLNAGLGYGGYCFPKDIQAFERLADRLGYDFALLREVEKINDEAVIVAVNKVRDALWNLEGKRIAILGLSFKPGTDDIRLSPALRLAALLIDEGASVVGFDPQAGASVKDEVPALEIAMDAYAAARDAHCMVLATEWDEFHQLDLERLRDELRYPIVVDGRNFFDPRTMQSLGFTYYSMGRKDARLETA